MAKPETSHGDKWPPEGCVAVGDYAFSVDNVPTQQQIDDAETFVFTRPEFVELEEHQRRLSVVRLATAAAASTSGAVEVGKSISLVHLHAPGSVAVIESKIHEGSVVTTYYSLADYERLGIQDV